MYINDEWTFRVRCTKDVFDAVTSNNLKKPRKDGALKKPSFSHKKSIIDTLKEKKLVILENGSLA